MSDKVQPDLLAELAKGGEALQQIAADLVESARQLAATSGQPFTQRLVRAANAALGELFPADPADVNIEGVTGRVTVTAVPGRVVTGSLRMVAVGTMTVAATVTTPDPDEVRLGVIVAGVLLVFLTAILLAVPAAERAGVDHGLTVLGTALAVATVLYANRKPGS